MKKLLAIVLTCALLTGCGAKPAETAPSTSVPETAAPTEAVEVVKEVTGDIVDILLEGQNITVSGKADGVYTSRDIIYYEDKEVYDSGNPYGEGSDADRHTKEEANAHLVVNITARAIIVSPASWTWVRSALIWVRMRTRTPTRW